MTDKEEDSNTFPSWFEKSVKCLFKYRLYRHSFTLSTLTYWYYYDGMKNSYISRIYKNDKYGVVINYVIINLVALLESLCCIDFVSFSFPEPTSHIKPRDMEDVIERRDRFKEIHLIKAVSIVSTGLRMLLFNIIFKNNTSDIIPFQKTVHVISAVLMGIVSVLTSSFVETNKLGFSLGRARHSFSAKWSTVLLMFFGASYQLSGWYADYLLKQGTNSALWNGITMFLEAQAIEHTIV